MQMRTKSFAKLAVLWSLGGLTAACAGSFLIPTTYHSQALLQIHMDSKEQSFSRLIDIKARLLSRTSLARVLNTPYLHLYSEELKKEPLEDVIEKMRANIKIVLMVPSAKPGNDITSFLISFENSDPQSTTRTVRDLTDLFIQADSGIQIIDPYSQPIPVSPNRAAIAATGFCSGFLIACIIWSTRKFRTTIPEPAAMNLQ